jgi:hypothetical protein
MRVRAGGILLLAGAAALACSSAPRDPVRAALQELEEAAEARDPDRFAAGLAAGFRGNGTGSAFGKAEAVAALRRYFAAYESVTLTVHEPEVETRENRSLVRCAVEFSGKANAAFGLGGLLPADAVYRFDLEMEEEGGTVKVTRATWEPAASPP